MDLKWCKWSRKAEKYKNRIGFWVREETGYKEYGPTVQLLEPIFFNVPIWEPKNLYLPYLDVTIDKTNIKENINTSQTGSTDRSDTEIGYQISKNQETYKIYTFEKSAHPGLTVDELANDFIHRVTYHSNNDKVKKSMNMISKNIVYLGIISVYFFEM